MPLRPVLWVGLVLGLTAMGLLVAGLVLLTTSGGPEGASAPDATVGGSLLGFGVLVGIGALTLVLRPTTPADGDADDERRSSG